MNISGAVSVLFYIAFVTPTAWRSPRARLARLAAYMSPSPSLPVSTLSRARSPRLACWAYISGIFQRLLFTVVVVAVIYLIYVVPVLFISPLISEWEILGIESYDASLENGEVSAKIHYKLAVTLTVARTYDVCPGA